VNNPPPPLLYPGTETMNLMYSLEKGAASIAHVNTSLQVKIFVHQNFTDAENSISSWLEENRVQIQHIGQSQSEKGGKFIFTVSVFYRTVQQ
jgi:hypothetical protein